MTNQASGLSSSVSPSQALRQRRCRAALGVLLSLLIHAALLGFLLTRNPPEMRGLSLPSNDPLLVQLNAPAAASAAAVEPSNNARRRKKRTASKPTPTPRTPVQSAKPTTLPAPTSPLATTEPQPVTPPAPSTPTANTDNAPTDMTTMLDAARARRRASNAAAGIPDADGENQNSTSNDTALANIKRDLQTRLRSRGDTGGVFRILSKGVRNAQFSFRGWNADTRGNWREVIDVDAGPQGDVELAIVRKMIELIRKHYSGDFNWESRRLGRVVVLSARREDNAGLEEFLIKEFFSNNG